MYCSGKFLKKKVSLRLILNIDLTFASTGEALKAFIISCIHSFTYCGDLYKGKKSLHSTTGGQKKQQKEKHACD